MIDGSEIPYVDLSRQYRSIQSDIDNAISEVFKKGIFIDGPSVSLFEKEFADYVGVSNCVNCANGSDGLEIALKAVGVMPGDEVIVPAISWISTADAVNAVGAEPVFVDVLPSEYTINPKEIEHVITSKTRAIIPVHLYGLPARMKEVICIAEKFDLKVVEDCAQAHGSRIDGIHVGNFGDVGVFSFYPTKSLGAYGDAGAVVTNNDELVEKIRRLGNHGQLQKHDHTLLGRNSRMDEVQAAILRVKLPYLDRWISERQEIATWYKNGLINKSVSIPEGYNHSYHIYPFVSDRRNQLIAAFNSSGIGYGIHYPIALPHLSAYAYQNNIQEQFALSNITCSSEISLPLFIGLTKSEVDMVCRVINSCLEVEK